MNAIVQNTSFAETDRAAFAAFLCDEEAKTVVTSLAQHFGWKDDIVFSGGIAGAVRMLGAVPCPEMLLVDLSESEDPRSDIQALADVCEAGTVVVATGQQNDVYLYRDLLHMGVHDYLIKPLDPAMLGETLTAAQQALSQPNQPEVVEHTGKGDRTVFIGVRGGLGTSMLAANVAWLFADRNQKSLLLDMDLHFGTSAMQFDLEPGRGLADALENPERVDGLFLERATVKPHANLSILGSEAPVGSLLPPGAGAVRDLNDMLSDNFQHVIMDLPRQMLAENGDCLEGAKNIVLVTDYSLTAARDCIRLLAHIRQSAPAANIHIVASRTTGCPQEVTEKDFENSIEHSVAVTIPFEPKLVLAAAEHGKLMVSDNAGSKVSAAVRDLARKLSPESGDAVAQTGWFNKLFKKAG